MHPTKKELELYVAGLPDDPKRREDIKAHMEICEFCREYLENFILMRKSLDELSQQELPVEALSLADKLYRQAFAGQVIPLEMLASEKTAQPLLMAADGGEKFTPDTVSLATYFSKDPELVLKIMRDNRKNQDYLQLIGDSPQAGANVLIQIPETELEFFTDSEGTARIADLDLRKLENYTWQIKMPDAVFELEPMQYDPEKIEYSQEITLETEKNDKIQIAFEGKTEGKQISIRILELEGKSEFEHIRVHISQEDKSVIKSVGKDGKIIFDLDDLKSPINIRLYT